MGQESFADAALVLFGHGSTLNPESGAPVFQHAAELRRRNCFADVREAFWKQKPRLVEVLPAIRARRVFLVPLFISEGYFSNEVIPRELGFGNQGDLVRVQPHGPQTLTYCQPVGSHSSMTGVLLARARGVVEQFPFPRAPRPEDITLFVAGHGTEENENSRVAIERQVELLRTMGLYAAVHGVFLEEEPRIGECYQIALTRNIVVVPFFISDGMHVREDIPVLLGEPKRLVQQRLQTGQPTWRNPNEKQGKLVWYASAVGTEPLIANVILERAREADKWLNELKS
ncbi:MAG TPA: CbiX/SirB N-terminal domain-containing protein [Candidatus Binatia bacterium]|nr:CbiX/SirB N-terminal domain-containing protein [Candidatus Binatia bacterium]